MTSTASALSLRPDSQAAIALPPSFTPALTYMDLLWWKCAVKNSVLHHAQLMIVDNCRSERY